MSAVVKQMPQADTVRQARIDLAAALRWSARLGLHEGAA
jgi:hypothetical protein